MHTLISILLFALSFVPLVAGNELTKEYAHLLVLAFGIIGAIGCYQRRDLLLFITPNAIMFFYATISIGLGAWAHANGYVIKAENLAVYEGWQFMNVALAIVMLSLTIFLSVDFRYHASYQKGAIRTGARCGTLHLIAACVLLPFFLAQIDLSSFGGAGDLSIIGK
jgi:hypothetical protein